MGRLVFDIETNGLLDVLTKIHCIVIADPDTEVSYSFGPDKIEEALETLANATHLYAHNGFAFDYLAIRKLFPEWKPKGVLHDTIAQTRLVFSDIKDQDFKAHRAGTLEPKYIGSHALKAWGYRLGVLKGEFAENTDWQEYSEEMLEYCEQDVEVTLALLKTIEAQDYSSTAIELEEQVTELMCQQEVNGFVFDVEKAQELYLELLEEKTRISKELHKVFGSWYVFDGHAKAKKSLNYKDKLRPDVTEGVRHTKVKRVTFNPSSRAHIAHCFKARYQWEPSEFTDNGQAKVDESVLSKLEFPEAKALSTYLMLDKRLGQLAEGRQAWLKLERDGKLHGRVNPNGAVTGRATHSNPNVAQVPAVRAPYGKQCRELFTVPQGWFLVGSDASGLELRCLGHYMARYDKGAYIKEILDGDIHTVNQHAAGLPSRDNAKTFIYAFLYGAGDEKIGSIVKPSASPSDQRRCGKRLKKRFLDQTPALRSLREAVTSAATRRKYLRGLDGRNVAVRSQHAALNTLLQSAGALICKHWIVTVDQLLKTKGLKQGWDGDYVFCAWVHDEAQIACRTKEIAKVVGETCLEAIKVTEKFFNFRCPLDADYSVGKNWADTH